MYQSSPRTKKYFAKLFLLCVVFHLCLGISGQSTGRVMPRITLSARNITVTDVFKSIKTQTGKVVWFMNEDINTDRRVSVKFDNASLDEVMKFLFSSTLMTWSYDEDKIILRKKKEPITESVASPIPFRVDTTQGGITVTGKVTDEKGSTIIGATVVVKGTRYGVTTDGDGGFILKDVKPNVSLDVSSLGYLTQEVAIRGKSSVGNVKLKEYVKELDETVIIAYGTTTKRYSTSNVSTIKAEEIEKQPVGNPLLALQGRVPSLLISPDNSVPGGGVTVRIQGQNSIGSGNDPLYVVDGVPYASQTLVTTSVSILGNSGDPSGNSGSGNPLSYINPSDIESIDVLKDADATAIYGSRAANGAILITTKKGKVGTAKVNIDIQNGWGRVAHMMPMMNTTQYLEMRNEALKNDGISKPGGSDYDLNGVWDKNRNTDWQKTLMGGTAQYSNINAGVSGGSTTVQYLVGGTYHRETTIFRNNFSDQKGSIHFNLNTTSTNQKFKVQLSGNYLLDNNLLPALNLTSTALQLPPNAPALYNTDGSLNWQLNSSGTPTWNNPLAIFLNKYQNKTTNVIGNSVLSYQILPELVIRSSFGYNNLLIKEFTGNPLVAIRPDRRPFLPRSAVFSNSTINSWIVEPQLNYKRTIHNGLLDVLLGATIQQKKNDGINIGATGYNNDDALADIFSAANVTVNSTVVSLYKYNALFGRLNYSWKDRYILNFTGRRDGSSRFGAKNQFHNFGSIAAAWIFSEEYLIKRNVSFLSFGKLRGSYGTTGNDQIPDYQFFNLYRPISINVAYQGGTGLIETRLTNPYLQWEETKKCNLELISDF